MVMSTKDITRSTTATSPSRLSKEKTLKVVLLSFRKIPGVA